MPVTLAVPAVSTPPVTKLATVAVPEVSGPLELTAAIEMVPWMTALPALRLPPVMAPAVVK